MSHWSKVLLSINTNPVISKHLYNSLVFSPSSTPSTCRWESRVEFSNSSFVSLQRHDNTAQLPDTYKMSRWCLSGQLKPILTEGYVLLSALDWHDHIRNCALSREWAAAGVGSLSAIILSLGQKYHRPCTLQSRCLPTGGNMCAACFLMPNRGFVARVAIRPVYNHEERERTPFGWHTSSHFDGEREPQLFSFFSLFQASVSCSSCFSQALAVQQ